MGAHDQRTDSLSGVGHQKRDHRGQSHHCKDMLDIDGPEHEIPKAEIVQDSHVRNANQCVANRRCKSPKMTRHPSRRLGVVST